MSALASAKKRRGVPATPPPPVASSSNSQQSSASSSNNLTLPQVIAVIDKRLIQLESAVRSPAVASSASSVPFDMSIMDEFNERFNILAEEISGIKDIVLKLQSYTMDVNKTLLEERVHILSDMGESYNKPISFNFSNSENVPAVEDAPQVTFSLSEYSAELPSAKSEIFSSNEGPNADANFLKLQEMLNE